MRRMRQCRKRLREKPATNSHPLLRQPRMPPMRTNGRGAAGGPSVTCCDRGEDQAESEASREQGITILARRCPPEVAGQDVALEEICTEPASDLTFEVLVDDKSTGTSVTDASGELAIPAEAGPGIYLFRQQPAEDLVEVTTECTSIYANGATASGQSRAVGSQMSELYLTYDGASRVTCTFYFVMDAAAPEDGAATDESEEEGNVAAAPHTLTFQFWTCPVEIDPAADQVNLVQACSTDTGERSFMLTVDGDTTGRDRLRQRDVGVP